LKTESTNIMPTAYFKTQFAGGGFSPVFSTVFVSVVVVEPSGVVTVVSVVELAFSPQPIAPTANPPQRTHSVSVRFICFAFHEKTDLHEVTASGRNVYNTEQGVPSISALKEGKHCAGNASLL